jgi:hypothetical protein
MTEQDVVFLFDADVTIERIGDLVNYDLPALMGQKEKR